MTPTEENVMWLLVPVVVIVVALMFAALLGRASDAMRRTSRETMSEDDPDAD